MYAGVDSNSTLLSVCEKIFAKYDKTLNPRDFNFYYLDENIDIGQQINQLLHYKNNINLRSLGMQLPVKCLKSKELLLIKKFLLDIPIRVNNLSKVDGTFVFSPQFIQHRKEQAISGVRPPESELTEDEILLNEITATTYKASSIFTIGIRSNQNQRKRNTTTKTLSFRQILSLQ